MRAVTLSRVSLALLIVAVLIGGVVLGGAVTVLGLPDATATPTASPTAVPTMDGLPSADVDGDDLPRLPRYPDSVRSEYQISVDDRFRLTITEYLADATVDEVRRFYQGIIEEHGWQRADINYSGGEWTYVLVDGSTEALVEIEESGGLVEIDLQLSEPVGPSPTPRPTPEPTARPAPPAPPTAAPTPDDDDDDDDDDGDDDGTDDHDGTDG